MRWRNAFFGLILLASGVDAQTARPVVVGSKPFGESYLLAEMFSQLLEARGLSVTRRPGLGATEIAFPALRRGDIDVYPEYTGTGLLVILKATPVADPQAVFDTVQRRFASDYDVRWLPPLGFENTYAMSVRTSMADSLGLRTLSDLVAKAPSIRAGFTADFIGLPDGLPGLRTTYGLNPRSVNALAPAVKYQALASGAVDLIDAYSTDGMLSRYPLTVLQDDRRFFPPYDAAAVVRGALVRDRPDVVVALTELSGRISVKHMREWNRRLEMGESDVAATATQALRELGLVDVDVARTSAPATRDHSLLAYLWSQRAIMGERVARHLQLVGISLLVAILLGVPMGLLLSQKAVAEPVIRTLGVVQTIPGIALLAFMLPWLGIGVTPAIVALLLYSMYPIVRNTVTGVQQVDRIAVDAGTALGMTPGQILQQVRLPLAVPVIMAGIRTAAVLNVGTATLAAFIGAGGLGDPIVSGLALADTPLILSGAIPAAALAVVVDGILGWTQRRLAVTTSVR